MPARSLRTIFSATSAFSGAASISNVSSERLPLSRRSLWLPVAVAIACAFGPSALGQTGLFPVGAAAAFLGAAVVFVRSGRRAGNA